jgi:hypothetical protein
MYNRGLSGGRTIIIFLSVLMLFMTISLVYTGYQKYGGDGDGDGDGDGGDGSPGPTFSTEEDEDGQIVFTQIEPSDCSGTEYVKKKSCHNKDTGELLDGSVGKCGDGVEEWVLDPNALGYQRAVGSGKCESDFRPCNVVCDKSCQGDTWIEGACIRNGVILDGSETDKCGRGIRTYTLDENAIDYEAATGNGTCLKTYQNACDVECPANAVAPPACVYSSTRQKSANGCVTSKEDGAPTVGYDEDGFQEYFKLALEPENCTGEERISEWETCRGPPAPIDCVGTWETSDSTESGGWGICTSTCGIQSTKSRTFKITQEAENGGTACQYADGETEIRNCNVPIQPCCEVGPWVDGTCNTNGYMTKTRTLTENSSGACAIHDSSKVESCCYQAGDWTADGSCEEKEAGKQFYKQTITGNCPPGTDTKSEECRNCVYKQQRTTDKYCFKYYMFQGLAAGKKNVVLEQPIGTGASCPETFLAYRDSAYTTGRESCDYYTDPNFGDAYDNEFASATWVDI